MSKSARFFMYFCLMHLLWLGDDCYSQSRDDAVKELVAQNKAMQTKFDSLKSELGRLEDKYLTQQDANKILLESANNSINRSFELFYIFGAIGSLFGGIFVWLSVSRQRTEKERMRKIEERETDRYYFEMAQLSQNLDLGQVASTKFDSLLTTQIENISGLRNVIGLVRETFNMQLKREKKQEIFDQKLASMQSLVDSLFSEYNRSYKYIIEKLDKFKSYTRMEWAHLNYQETQAITNLRIKFEVIPQMILDENLKDDPNTLARVNQLLGVSAFCSNDIENASRFLMRAHDIYRDRGYKDDTKYSYIYSKYYLALIAKSWLSEGVDIATTLNTAAEYLSQANELLKDKENEFLTPLALAEVYSYLDSKKTKAKSKLDQIISGLENLLVMKKASEDQKVNTEKEDNEIINQKRLLVRAFLIRGNIEFSQNNYDKSIKFYTSALRTNSKSHDAMLSKALALYKQGIKTKLKEVEKYYEEGIKLLESSNSLTTGESTIRIIGLVWGLHASDVLNDEIRKKKYKSLLNETIENLHSVVGRKPLMFSPLSKNLVDCEGLKMETKNMIGELL